jgi:hypothetical protein
VRKTLTPKAEAEAVRLYSLRDSRGKAVYTQLEIGVMLGVSETTIFRLLKKDAFRFKAPAVNRSAAAESEARMRESMAPRKATPLQPYADLDEEELVRPDEDDMPAPTILPPYQGPVASHLIQEVCDLPVQPSVITKMKGYLG